MIKICVQIYEKIRRIYQSRNKCNYAALRHIVYKTIILVTSDISCNSKQACFETKFLLRILNFDVYLIIRVIIR